MPRYRLTIEYDGIKLVGWQRQPNGGSVQAALSGDFAVPGGDGQLVHGAGRTDAGVHALAQCAHVDLAREAPAETIRGALNHHLRPAAIVVLAVEPAPTDFHARISATGRVYRYRQPPAAADARPDARLVHVAPPLDLSGDAGGRRAPGRQP